ncbi:RNA recognition motif domain-containing protein [Ditylenchus destructor]|nr:RNA recognition motif domain-containing protein [Ditylenchus destructor]
MSSLRNILRRCALNASILGNIPLQIQCASTFNPVYSAYPTSMSRQSYSSDANDAPNADPVQKYILEMIYSIKSPPNVAEDKKAAKGPIFEKNLNLRKYYINIRGLSRETTPESLREFYSQFGEIAYYAIVFPGESHEFGSVAFTSREAMDHALNSLPHCIDGKATKKVRPGVPGRNQLTLQLVNLSPKTTNESLKAFYSKFGPLNNCWIKPGITDAGYVTFVNHKDMHRALDAQPHVIDGSEVFLKYVTYDLDLEIMYIPEGITEEELIAFYSKYGQLRDCRLLKGRTGISHAFVSYSALHEVNRAMDDRPHIIGGKCLQIKFIGKGHNSHVSLVVGSIPKNVTEETLREEFSKYGKPVYWKLERNVHFNQSGLHGIVSYRTISGFSGFPETINHGLSNLCRRDRYQSLRLIKRKRNPSTDWTVMTRPNPGFPEAINPEPLKIRWLSRYFIVDHTRSEELLLMSEERLENNVIVKGKD